MEEKILSAFFKKNIIVELSVVELIEGTQMYALCITRVLFRYFKNCYEKKTNYQTIIIDWERGLSYDLF